VSLDPHKSPEEELKVADDDLKEESGSPS